MKIIKNVSPYLLFLILVGLPLSLAVAAQSGDKDFASFLEKFTTSASFQYSRIKFPLESPITLAANNDEGKTYPFTREKWPLLDAESFKVERSETDEDGVYIARFVLDEADDKEFEAGYEEGQLDLRVVFKRIEGKWYVTDCYNAWYSSDLPAEEFDDAVYSVQEENKAFIEQYP